MSAKRDLKIMLADDDEDDRELFAQAVEASLPEAQLAIAENGNVLLQKLKNSPEGAIPDVLFLDMNMPIKNGKECLSEIRSSQQLSAIPVIIYSTSGNQEQVDEMYAHGADYYIRKPSSFSLLKEMLQVIGSMDWASHCTPERQNFVLLQGPKSIGQ
ncbi:MAG: response regulator [Bacteroidetes bacterium]|nr:response regulator [Bacteroidota bacterium]